MAILAGGLLVIEEPPAQETPAVIAYRDHRDSPPWSVDELHERIQKG